MEIVLALFDFIPVILCFISLAILQECLYSKMKKYSFALLASGSIMILVAGVLKAIWKLIYYGAKVDFYRFNYLFFPIQGIGFILAFAGILIMIIDIKRAKTINKSNSLNSIFLVGALPVAEEGFSLANDTMMYVAMQMLGVFGIYLCVSYMAIKLKKKWIVGIIVVAFICMLGMGYLSTKINRSTGTDWVKYNWIAEIVNTLGQTLFLFAIVKLKKAGLKDIEL